jgi:hypothetical protein
MSNCPEDLNNKWPAKKRSFDLVEATATARRPSFVERVPPAKTAASNLPFDLTSMTKIITFDCHGILVQRYEVLLRELASTLTDHGQASIEALRQ